jgi:hypothetical protein
MESSTAMQSNNRTKADGIGESKLIAFVHQTSQETPMVEKEQNVDH